MGGFIALRTSYMKVSCCQSPTRTDIACQLGPKIGPFSIAGVGRLSMHCTSTPSLVLELRTLVQRGTNST